MPYKIKLVAKGAIVDLKYNDGKSFFKFSEKSKEVTIDKVQLQKLFVRLKPLTEQKILYVEEFSDLPKKEKSDGESKETSKENSASEDGKTTSEEGKEEVTKPVIGKPFQKKEE